MNCRKGGSALTFKPRLAMPVEEYFKFDIIQAGLELRRRKVSAY